MSKRGFVSLPFLVLFGSCLSLCTVLCSMIFYEIEILENVRIMNQQVLKEDQILKEVVCMIQCDHPHSMSLMINDEEVSIECGQGMCLVSASFGIMEILYDENEHRILSVKVN